MSKVTKTLAAVLLAVSLFLVNPISALAADSEPTINLKPEGYDTITNQLSVSSLVAGAIRLILVVAAILFFFMLVIGGVQWIVSGGDKAGSENARKRITSALVGLAIVFAAWAIAALIKTLFGVDILNVIVPTFYTPSP